MHSAHHAEGAGCAACDVQWRAVGARRLSQGEATHARAAIDAAWPGALARCGTTTPAADAADGAAQTRAPAPTPARQVKRRSLARRHHAPDSTLRRRRRARRLTAVAAAHNDILAPRSDITLASPPPSPVQRHGADATAEFGTIPSLSRSTRHDTARARLLQWAVPSQPRLAARAMVALVMLVPLVLGWGPHGAEAACVELPDPIGVSHFSEWTSRLAVATFLVALGIVFEHGQEAIIHHANRHTRPIVQSLFQELTLLGFVGLFLFVVEQSSLLTIISAQVFDEAHSGLLVVHFHQVHMILFLVMMLYLGTVLLLMRIGLNLTNQWRDMEKEAQFKERLMQKWAEERARQQAEREEAMDGSRRLTLSKRKLTQSRSMLKTAKAAAMGKELPVTTHDSVLYSMFRLRFIFPPSSHSMESIASISSSVDADGAGGGGAGAGANIAGAPSFGSAGGGAVAASATAPGDVPAGMAVSHAVRHLTPDNARAYRKRHTVQAFALSEHLRIDKRGGVNEGSFGDWLIVDHDTDIRVMRGNTFHEAFVAVDGSPHVYRKRGAVLAAKMHQNFTVITGKGEIQRGHAGDFLLQTAEGEQMTLTALDFNAHYQLVSSRDTKVGRVLERMERDREWDISEDFDFAEYLSLITGKTLAHMVDLNVYDWLMLEVVTAFFWAMFVGFEDEQHFNLVLISLAWVGAACVLLVQNKIVWIRDQLACVIIDSDDTDDLARRAFGLDDASEHVHGLGGIHFPHPHPHLPHAHAHTTGGGGTGGGAHGLHGFHSGSSHGSGRGASGAYREGKMLDPLQEGDRDLEDGGPGDAKRAEPRPGDGVSPREHLVTVSVSSPNGFKRRVVTRESLEEPDGGATAAAGGSASGSGAGARSGADAGRRNSSPEARARAQRMALLPRVVRVLIPESDGHGHAARLSGYLSTPDEPTSSHGSGTDASNGARGSRVAPAAAVGNGGHGGSAFSSPLARGPSATSAPTGPSQGAGPSASGTAGAGAGEGAGAGAGAAGDSSMPPMKEVRVPSRPAISRDYMRTTGLDKLHMPEFAPPPYTRNPQPGGYTHCKRWLLGRPPNRHEALFWFDRKGPHLLFELLRAIPLIMSLYLSVISVNMVTGPCKSADKVGTCLLESVLAAVPPVVALLLLPRLFKNYVLVTNIEMMKKRQVVGEVIRHQRTQKAMRALRMLSAMKVHSKRIYEKLSSSAAEGKGASMVADGPSGNEDDADARVASLHDDARLAVNGSSGRLPKLEGVKMLDEAGSDGDSSDEDLLAGDEEVMEVIRQESLNNSGGTGGGDDDDALDTDAQELEDLVKPKRGSKVRGVVRKLSNAFQSGRRRKGTGGWAGGGGGGSKAASREAREQEVAKDMLIGAATRVYGEPDSIPYLRRRMELQEVFKLFDRDHNGTVDAHDMENVFELLGMSDMSAEAAKQMVREVDVSNKGFINFNDFFDWMAFHDGGASESQEEINKFVFNIIDTDGSNEITVEELRRVLASLGEVMSEADVSQIVREADTDGSGTINLHEFSRLLQQYTDDGTPNV